MSLVDLCVRRPVFATMLVVALVVLGLASYRDLGLDIFPKVDIPTVTVTTRLPGASPEEVESQVTKRIEEVVNTISGIDELRSTTIEGQSQVFVSFILDRDIEAAAQDVREKVATILSQLPQGTETPVVEKFDFDAAPVMALVVSGRRSAREITELAEKRIKRALEGVKDIGAVTLVGQRKREIQIAVDPNRLAAYGLSIQQVQAALARQNVEVPGGRLTGEGREEGLRTLGRVTAVADFETIVVAESPRGPVRVRDVAQVLDAEEEPRTLSRLDGNNAVSLLVRKQSGTNTNVLRGRGLSRFEAQLEADRARLRPILMTTLAIVFGMLPVALGRGDGSASRAALAIAVVGGQALCLVVTLVITPVVYSFFDDLRGWPRRLLAWRPARRPRPALGRRLEAGLNDPREA